MDPICHVLNNRLDIIETVFRDDGDEEDETGTEARATEIAAQKGEGPLLAITQIATQE